jgi:adenosylcobinamide-GDP ribazoletransferase
MLADLRGALTFLTVLPVGYPEGGKPGAQVAYYPLVGLLIGLCVAGMAALPLFSPEVRAALALIVWVALTGGLHLDGFADSCDGLLATVDPARRLEIMKDPRCGAFAVIGVGLLLIGKYSALQHIPPLMLLLPVVLGRWSMVLALAAFPYARSTGLGAYFREGFGRTQVILAAAFAIVISAVVSAAVDVRLLMLLAVPPLTVLLIGRWAAVRLGGGLTGDVYGALCELTELFCLLMIDGMLWTGS